MATRDEIRAATLGAPAVVESKIVEWRGVQMEVRRPTLKQQREISRASTDKSGNRDDLQGLAHAIVRCVYVPGSTERVFTVEDVDGLLDRGEKDFVGVLTQAIADLSRASDPEVIEKNSVSGLTVSP